MKHCLAAVAIGVTVSLAGCDGTTATQEAPTADETNAASAETSDLVASAPDAKSVNLAMGEPIKGAPEFVSLYPGAVLTDPEEKTSRNQVNFLTEADPDTVIDFYRAQAEASGMRPTAAMNQGTARAYGAASRDPSGVSLQVVASPSEDGATVVQINWTGRS